MIQSWSFSLSGQETDRIYSTALVTRTAGWTA